MEVLIDYYVFVQQGDQTIEARKTILIEQRAEHTTRMDELKKTLDLLNYKISAYETAMVEKEQDLAESEVQYVKILKMKGNK